MLGGGFFSIRLKKKQMCFFTCRDTGCEKETEGHWLFVRMLLTVYSFKGGFKFYSVACVESILCSWHKAKDNWFVSIPHDET